jgi:hypothetical protein
LRVRATRSGGVLRIRALGPSGPVAGAVVRAGSRWALTDARGLARIHARHATVARADLRAARA